MYVFKSWILDFFQTFTSNDTEQGIINQPDLFCWNYLTYRSWSQATSLLLYSLIKKANESHVSRTLHRFYQENLIFNLITATLSKPVEQHLIKNAFFSDNLVKLKQGERCWRVQSLALEHTDPRLFIHRLIYACLGLSQSKDFTLQASGPQ